MDGLVLPQSVDVAYVTAFTGCDSWAMITKNRVYLLTDSRYGEQARTQCAGTVVVERQGTIAEAVGMLIRKFTSVGTVGVEHSISVAA